MSIKVGIVGAGGIAGYHIRGYQQAGATLAAVCDTNQEAAKATAVKFDIPKTYESLAAMLKGEKKLDAVSLCVPNKFHAALAIEAAKAGLHVFCEKPPALNAAEAQEMAQAAKAAGTLLCFDFNNRARPEAAALKRYIDDGTVGKINSAQALWVRRCGIPGYGGWFTQQTLSGGGPTIDLLHMLDLSLWFMGYPNPTWVSATAFSDFAHDSSFSGPWGLPVVKGGTMDVETASQAMVTFDTGQSVYTRMSWAEMNEREEVSVVFQGSKAGGRIRRLFGIDGLDDTAIDDCRLFTHENDLPVNRDVIVSPDPAMGRVSAVVNFVQAVAGDAQPLSDAEEGVKLMKIIEAIYRSAKNGQPVEVAKM